jgi:hypothetical protein
MRYLLLCTSVWVTFLAHALMPYQTAHAPAHTSRDIKRNPIGELTPVPAPIHAHETVTPQENDDLGGKVTKAGKQEPVKVIEFPPVNVKKDWMDRFYWVFSGLLLFVGAGGVFLARKTLKTIERQALSMRRQTTLLRRSVAASRKGARAALLNAQAVINAERAWVFAELGWYDRGANIVENAVRGRESTSAFVRLTCRNEGKTPAWIDHVYSHVDIVSAVSVTGDPDRARAWESRPDRPTRCRKECVEGPGTDLPGPKERRGVSECLRNR